MKSILPLGVDPMDPYSIISTTHPTASRVAKVCVKGLPYGERCELAVFLSHAANCYGPMLEAMKRAIAHAPTFSENHDSVLQQLRSAVDMAEPKTGIDRSGMVAEPQAERNVA